jgi:excinuclease UvrABC ATPase subunit
VPLSDYTKNTYLTFSHHTTPRFFSRRDNVNICNKPDGSGKNFTLYFDMIPPSALRSGAVSNKKEENPFVTNLYKKNAPFFSNPLTKP